MRTRDSRAERPLASTAERALVGGQLQVGAAALAVVATIALWSGAEVHRALLVRVGLGALAAALFASSARSFFFEAARVRHPWRPRASAAVGALLGAYLVALAVRGS